MRRSPADLHQLHVIQRLLPHVQACIDYVRSLPNVVFKTSAIAAAGVSNGGIMAIPMATRYSVFTHAMLFHSR